MSPRGGAVVHAVALAICLFSVSLAAAGDAAAQGPGPTTQGPMIIEQIHSGFLAAPDAKVTTVDHRTSGLVGGYAGWLAQETFFIGGAGYWLANNSNGRRMAYGGLRVGWLGRTDRRIGWSVTGLIGGGEATLSETRTVTPLVPNPAIPPVGLDHDFPRFVPGPSQTVQLRVRDHFFVAEPEATLSIRLSKHVRLTGGGGYRAVSSERRDDSRLSGAVGSVGLQIGGGS